ncbi:hypothetical protein CVAR_1952 [Corynebacterium variabile DSM 44702]|uniref:Glyoxalase-like domain-containing protein n=1 Tax=Corynebacterium variabile (strain DSM 44702 / CIP 107183 / JCM 12073 / NCIMB 30131) TaxID=858619 RepID=G0HFQ2_CORVD|nr:VOC family protein [Corynebacterium variabile]AEK37305.1 hypothetical protein CVAR_1952 [Corynebacterium variabile DSM 44702]
MTPPPAAFDHLIHWVSDLDATVASYKDAGLTTHPALTMPGFRNAAWGIDDARYVELATVDRLRSAGHEVIIDEVWLEDRQGGFTEVHVTDTPHVAPFFIAYNPPREVIARMRAEHRAANGVAFAPDRTQLVALFVGSNSPEQDAANLAELIGCGVRGTTVELQYAEVRFSADAPEGLYGIAVSDLDDHPVEIAGLKIFPEL